MKKTVKKHVAEAALVSFTFASVLPGGAAFAAADVTDVNGHWAEQAIHDWMERGYIGGYEDNTFRPDQTITRAEFVNLVNKTIDADQTATIAFSDVSDSDWFAGEVALALGEGYVSGFEDGTFRPGQPVTRAQAAAFLAKALKLTGDADAVADMTDSAAIPDWAAGAIGAVVAKGYMGGYEDGTFGPNRPLTRAEAVSMLNRVLNDDGNEDTKPPVVIGGGGSSSGGSSGGGGGSVTRYTVTFDTDGGSAVASVTVKRGDKLTRPADPTRTGYTFGGWYTDEACTIAWDFENDTVKEATTLYAKWVKEEKSEYGFNFTMPDKVVAGEEQSVDMMLEATTINELGYEKALIQVDVKKPEGSTVSLVANDGQNDYDLAQIGFWGPKEGFAITSDYKATTPVKATFSQAGDYTITLTLVDVANNNAEIATKAIEVKVEAAPVVEEKSEYGFNFTMPDKVVAGEEQSVDMMLEATTINELGYEKALIQVDVKKPEGSTVSLVANDGQNDYDLAQIGFWGPKEGFAITSDYKATTPVKATFSQAGDYTITLTLVDVANNNAEIVTKAIEVKVEAVPVIAE